MLRARFAMMVFVPALFAGSLACGLESTVDEPAGDAQADLRKAPPIIGTFRNEGGPLGIAVLTLKTNWTYHMEEAIVCIHFPCKRPQTNGPYTYGMMNGMSVLVLRDEESGALSQFKFKAMSDSLAIAPYDENGPWQTLQRSGQAWCQEPLDCRNQNLPPGPCAGLWTCETDACKYFCGSMSLMEEVGSSAE